VVAFILNLLVAISLYNILFCYKFNGYHTHYELSNNHRWFICNFIFGYIIDGFFLIFFLLVLPAKIILLISIGKPFDISNIRNLNAISYCLLSMDFVYYAENVLLEMVSKNNFSFKALFETNFKTIGWQWYLLAGAIVFVIARAFKRGYDLQKEQELTI